MNEKTLQSWHLVFWGLTSASMAVTLHHLVQWLFTAELVTAIGLYLTGALLLGVAGYIFYLAWQNALTDEAQEQSDDFDSF